MSKPKTKRNKSRPARPGSPFAGLIAIARRQADDEPLTDERQSNVCIAYHRAIEAMTDGSAEEYHFNTVVYALDIGVVLAENGLGGEHIELLRAAVDGMARTKERYLSTGRMGLDGDALTAIREVYPLHEEQMRLATMAELHAARTEMHRRIEAFKQAA